MPLGKAKADQQLFWTRLLKQLKPFFACDGWEHSDVKNVVPSFKRCPELANMICFADYDSCWIERLEPVLSYHLCSSSGASHSNRRVALS